MFRSAALSALRAQKPATLLFGSVCTAAALTATQLTSDEAKLENSETSDASLLKRMDVKLDEIKTQLKLNSRVADSNKIDIVLGAQCMRAIARAWLR